MGLHPSSYIPLRLHQEDKPLLNQFALGDVLYHRCDKGSVEDGKMIANPYSSVTLAELSHNIGSNRDNIISYSEDVLYSIKEEESFEKHTDKDIAVLEVVSLDPQSKRYIKHIKYRKNEQSDIHKATIELIHEPDYYMYPHCVFRIQINDRVVTYKNYSDFKKLKGLRQLIRNEITTMLNRGIIGPYRNNPS